MESACSLSAHWHSTRWFLGHMMEKYVFGTLQSDPVSFLFTTTIKLSRAYPSRKMALGFFPPLLTSQFIFTTLRPCFRLKIILSMSMEISGWIRKRRQFSLLRNIWVSSFSATLIILPRRMSLQRQDKSSRYGHMKEPNPFINWNGTWIQS